MEPLRHLLLILRLFKRRQIPSSFGKGNIIGVIAPESANNAKDGGSLVPTVAFGIPGSAETAVFLGILVLHGIDPGPTLLLENEREIYGLIIALTLSAVGASLIGLLDGKMACKNYVRECKYISSISGYDLLNWCLCVGGQAGRCNFGSRNGDSRLS